MKILIADDNPLDRSILQMTLEKWGYEVTACSDGTEALAALNQPDAPPLAILDWMMPGKTGPEICAEIRFQQTKQYLYVIILSSRTEKSDVISGMQSGADDYLDKPVDVSELQVRLRAGQRIIELQADLIAAREELRIQATQDFLTEIPNRAAIMDILNREFNRSVRTNSVMGILMSDIDKFKDINDNYGHPAGDAVLKEVAKRISECLREYDSVGRFGGEEFLFVVAEIGPKDVKGMAERVRHSVCDLPIAIPNSEITVTMSFGVALLAHGKVTNKEELIGIADKALYAAKESGRNRVVIADMENYAKEG
jgi:two-component system cell cycle response regulator